MLDRFLCILIGYLIGNIQSGYFMGKAHGIDIREHGSGNSGATNTLRVLGTKSGITVLLCDALKCIIAVVITYFLFGKSQPELKILFRLYTALGVILGHNFPFWLNFKGGKGIAATAGLIITFGPLWIIGNLSLFCLIFFTTHFVSLGSLIIYLSLFLEIVICGQTGVFNTASVVIPQAVLIEMYAVTFIMTCMAYWRHRKNILRLVHHEESKVYLSKKVGDKHKEELENQKPII